MKSVFNPGAFFPLELIAYVGKAARISVDDLIGTDKTKRVTRVRAVIYMVMRERGVSFPRIAKVFNRNHTTIVHAVHTFDRFDDDPYIQALLGHARRFYEPQETCQ